MLKQFFELGQIEIDDRRQASQTSLGQAPAALPLQHPNQPLMDRNQVAHIVGGVVELGVRQLAGVAPVGALGGLIELDAHELLNNLLEAMARRVGAGEFAGNFGAEDRGSLDAEVVLEGGDIEPGEVENLEGGLGFEELLQARGRSLPWGNANNGDDALAIAELDEAKPIALGYKTHRLGIYGEVGGFEVAIEVLP
jgi:hypothetical protein